MRGGIAAANSGDAVAASPSAEQLRRGFRWLVFEPGLEPAYRAAQFRDSLRYLRFNLVILALIILTIIQIDQVVMPAISRVVPDLARIGVMAPLLAIGFALTFLQRADTWYPRVMTVAMAGALVAIAWIGLSAWAAGETRMFVRLIIATITVWFVLGLPFRQALAANLAGIVFYPIAAVSLAMPATELTHYLTMLLMTNVICAAGAYNLEHARRTAWLEGQLLAESALLDGLTGIHNRRRFDEHLQRVWQQGQREHKPVALLFADIDHFKAFNDVYGHQSGDEAMKAVARVLMRCARRPLDLAARYGGEEFAIVLFDIGRENALRIGEEILEEIRKLDITHVQSGAASVLTVSMGIACVVPAARRSPAGLVQLADQALYAAKDGGRNQVRVLEGEYEHMKTGYFRRHQLKDRDAGSGQ